MSVTRSHTRSTLKSEGQVNEILLVEDQRSLAQMAAQMLHERWKCRVLIATTLGQVHAILAQKKQHFFLAVSDLNLPDAPHGEVIDVLIDAGIPVIAMTGMLDEAMHQKIMSRGVVDYVLKDSINAYDYIVELVGRLFRNVQTKVLIVDDSETFCAMMSGMLKMQGLNVVTAPDGQAGLEALEQQPDIKLVLLDHEMPRMNGFNFLLNVRRRLGKDRLAVIGVAGAGNMAAKFLKLGANDFIAKPFGYEELVCRVSQNLDMQEQIEAVRHIAYHDHLTGLLNRRAFFEEGARILAEAVKAGSAPMAAVMDIDFFKKINDSYGHDGGDAVLRDFAALLGEFFAQDVVARVGGEEFALLFANPDRALAQCEAFRARVENSCTEFREQRIRFTVSIGVMKQRAENLDVLLKKADENLYRAKEGGRNRVVANL